MEGIIFELLGTLKVLGSVWLDHVEKDWSNKIEKLEKELWKETNKKPKDMDMAKIINIMEDIKRKNKKAQAYMMENVLKGKLVQ